jgi:hypothetical protein
LSYINSKLNNKNIFEVPTVQTSFNKNIVKHKLSHARELLNNSVVIKSNKIKNQSIILFENQLNRRTRRSRNFSDIRGALESRALSPNNDSPTKQIMNSSFE